MDRLPGKAIKGKSEARTKNTIDPSMFLAAIGFVRDLEQERERDSFIGE